MKNIRTTLIRITTVVVIIILLVISFRIGANFDLYQRDKEIIQIKTDTLIIHDTVKIEKPVYITKVVLDSILVPVPVVDTLRQTDTIFISLPREQKYYKGQDYEAWISGYKPELDSLNIFRTNTHISTTIQKQTRKANRFSIGIQVGYGVTLSQSPQFSPFVGVGVNYNLFTF